MNILFFEPTHSGLPIRTVVNLYEKNMPVRSVTKASDWFSNIDKVDELKKALLMAIDCGNFDKALFILKELQALKS